MFRNNMLTIVASLFERLFLQGYQVERFFNFLKMLALLIFVCFSGVVLCDQPVQEPQCMFEDNEAACCVKIGITSFKHKICMKTVLDLEKTQGKIGFYVDGKSKHETELATGPSCWPVESLPGVKQCINVYHLVLDTSRKVIESCALWNVGDLLQVRFACIKFEDGKLSHHNDIQPENYGVVTGTAEDGGKLEWQIKVKKVLKKWWEKTWSSIKNYVKPKPKDDILKFISSN